MKTKDFFNESHFSLFESLADSFLLFVVCRQKRTRRKYPYSKQKSKGTKKGREEEWFRLFLPGTSALVPMRNYDF
jgi:hypothetical protein